MFPLWIDFYYWSAYFPLKLFTGWERVDGLGMLPLWIGLFSPEVVYSCLAAFWGRGPEKVKDVCLIQTEMCCLLQEVHRACYIKFSGATGIGMLPLWIDGLGMLPLWIGFYYELAYFSPRCLLVACSVWGRGPEKVKDVCLIQTELCCLLQEVHRACYIKFSGATGIGMLPLWIDGLDMLPLWIGFHYGLAYFSVKLFTRGLQCLRKGTQEGEGRLSHSNRHEI